MPKRHGVLPPLFPGATGVSVLDVYDWPTPDGERGGSAHMHFASAEGYVVLSGTGRLQTLGRDGYAQTPLRTGDCLWFTPGTIHRLVNDGGLRILVVMQNAGLPEHGDAVLTFPPEVLADPDAYARAATLPGTGQEADQAAARRRRDLAITGYLGLRARVAAAGPAALEDFYAAALRLVNERVPGWRERWRDGALAAAALTGQHLDEIAVLDPGHLREGQVLRMAPLSEIQPDGRGYGMCGRLTAYRPPALDDA